MTATARPAAPIPKEAPPAKAGYRSVYLWHWPVRTMHWVAAGCVALLVVTGFYIGGPYFMTQGEASQHFLMGWMRFLHFAAAGLLIATAIVRVYWLFIGNRYERWQALFPFRRRDWRHMTQVLRKYLWIHPERAPHWLGHNPLQQLSYTLVYVAALTQVVTGFALYGLSNPGGFFASAFGWVAPLLGGHQIVRFVHHVMTWYFLVFLPIHIYLSLRADLLHREARISSIVDGFRFVRDDVEFIDE